MNMELKRVGTSEKGSAMKRRGTRAHCMTKASPPLSSTKKNRTLSAINAYVTSGKVLRALLSSPIGNMRRFYRLDERSGIRVLLIHRPAGPDERVPPRADADGERRHALRPLGADRLPAL